MKWSLPWVFKAVWNPIDWFDLRDRKDQVDHGKVIPWAFLVVAVVAHFAGVPFAWWELLALGSLSFGYGAWRTFLQSRSVTGQFTHQVSEVTQRIIQERRDHNAGIEPTED